MGLRYSNVFIDFRIVEQLKFDVLTGICEICNREFWYKKNMKSKPTRCGRKECIKAKTEKQKESHRIASAKYKAKNIEKVRKSQNDHYNEHKNERKEKHQIYNKQYYQNNKDYFLKHSKEQYLKNKNQSNEKLIKNE